MRTARPASAALLLGAVTLLSACGGSGPADVVQQATGTNSPSRCDLYTDSFFVREAGTSAGSGRAYCRQLAARLPVVHVRIGRVDVSGNQAKVTAVASGRTVVYTLVNRNGRWLIDSLS